MRKLILLAASVSFIMVLLPFDLAYAASPEQIISVYSEPNASKVIVARKGKDTAFPSGTSPTIIRISKKDPSVTLTMVNKDFKTVRIVLQGEPDIYNRKLYSYPETIYFDFASGKWSTEKMEIPKENLEKPKPAAEIIDPTIRAGAASEIVNRVAPGQSALERTIIRWYFDSDPRGCRIFWRVISSVPDQVKNTNETYLMTTPYEETRSFNILGLSYENSRDVTIEVKVSKRGYEDQVKRFNVRQAIDQQEISGFFELVEKSE